MIRSERMYREDAENLARMMQEEDPMIEIRDIEVDPNADGYVIVALDRRTDEQFLIESYSAWAERIEKKARPRNARVAVEKIHTRKGKKNATLRGDWVRLESRDWPDEICGSIEAGDLPGELLIEIEPELVDVESVEPGHGRPENYSVDGRYLILIDNKGAKVWKLVEKLANFTLEDQSDYIEEWRRLGFKISPKPQAPYIELENEVSEAEILEEVKERLLDISSEGYHSILVDGKSRASYYAWVVAGALGLSVVIGWIEEKTKNSSGFAKLSFIELLDYKSVEESILSSA